MTWWLIPVAYLCGMFPGAAIVARAYGVDIRTVGSGNPGASNVTRVLGWRRGIWAFVLDAMKGAIPAAVGLLVDGRVGGYALGATAIVGHIFPVTHGFRGGKGVATGGGVFAVLSPVVFVCATALWALVLKATKTASVASLAIVVLFPVGVWFTTTSWWQVGATIAIGLLIFVRHASNIRRLIDHDENSIASS